MNIEDFNLKLISGPYRATKLWNAAVRSFHAGMPTGRHRRGLRVYEHCFTGAEAVAWLHQHLCDNPNFAATVTKEQTATLLKKFLKCGLLEEASGGGSTGASTLMKDKYLYRMCQSSPLKALRTPGRSGNSSTNLRASTRRLAQAAAASPPLTNAHGPTTAHHAYHTRANTTTIAHARATAPTVAPVSKAAHGKDEFARGSRMEEDGRRTSQRTSQRQHVHQCQDLTDNTAVPLIRSQHQQEHTLETTRQRHTFDGGIYAKHNPQVHDGDERPVRNRSEILYATKRRCNTDKENDVYSEAGVGRPVMKAQNKNTSKEIRPSFRFHKRRALQSIENNEITADDNLRNKSNFNMKRVFNVNDNNKNNDIYIPIASLRNRKGSNITVGHNQDSGKIQEEHMDTYKSLNETGLTNNNLMNTGLIKDDIIMKDTENSSINSGSSSTNNSKTNINKSKSRVKSFLIKSSNNSKYYNLIPKFGGGESAKNSSNNVNKNSFSNSNSYTNVNKSYSNMNKSRNSLNMNCNNNNKSSSNSNVYAASSRTISPRLLHSVAGGQDKSQVVQQLVLQQKQEAVLHKQVQEDNKNNRNSSNNNDSSSIIKETEAQEAAYPVVLLQLLGTLLDGAGCPAVAPGLVVGAVVRHNQHHVTARGVVAVAAGHPDDLPAWALAAMRFLAHWPNVVAGGEGGGGIPSYPGVEVDVYRMVKDYFTHQKEAVIPSSLVTALVQAVAAAEFIDLTFRQPGTRFTGLRAPRSGEAITDPPCDHHSNLCDPHITCSDPPTYACGRRTCSTDHHTHICDSKSHICNSHNNCCTVSTNLCDLQTQPCRVACSSSSGSQMNGVQQKQQQEPEQEQKQEGLRRPEVGDYRRSLAVPLNNPESDDAAGYATLPRVGKGLTKQQIIVSSENADSVEDLMLNMSMCSNKLLLDNNDKDEICYSSSIYKNSFSSMDNNSVSATSVLSPPADSCTADIASVSDIQHSVNNSAIYVSRDDVRRRKKRAFFSRQSKKTYTGISNETNKVNSPDSSKRNECDDSLYSRIECYADPNKLFSYTGFSSPPVNDGNCSTVFETETHSLPNILTSSGAGNSCSSCDGSSIPSPFYAPDGSSVHLLSCSQIDQVSLPPNSCFETAFTSDSPKTRIIPQKSVDTLHLRQLKRRRRNRNNDAMRPKSIAVPHFTPDCNEFGMCNNFDINELNKGRTDFQSSRVACLHQCSVSEFHANLEPDRKCDMLAGGVLGSPANTLENSFINRSRSTGDLNLDEEWLEIESTKTISTCNLMNKSKNSKFQRGSYANSGILANNKGFNLMSKVRDSIRKAKSKEESWKRTRKHGTSSINSSCNNMSHSSTSCSNISNNNNYTTCNDRCNTDNNQSTNLVKASLSVDTSGEMQQQQHQEWQQQEGSGPAVVHNGWSAECGAAVHNGNLRTLSRLRTRSGGFSNPALVLTPTPKPLDKSRYNGDVKKSHGSNACVGYTGNRTSIYSKNYQNGADCSISNYPKATLISPIVCGGPTAEQPVRNLVNTELLRSISPLSPFSPLSNHDNESVSLLSFTDIAHKTDSATSPSTVYTSFSNNSNESSTAVDACCVSHVPLRHSSTNYTPNTPVSNTIYPTYLSTHYATNQATAAINPRSGHYCTTPSGCLSHAMATGRSTGRSTPATSVLTSKSTSLSSLYTTALACHDESDSQVMSDRSFNNINSPPIQNFISPISTSTQLPEISTCKSSQLHQGSVSNGSLSVDTTGRSNTSTVDCVSSLRGLSDEKAIFAKSADCNGSSIVNTTTSSSNNNNNGTSSTNNSNNDGGCRNSVSTPSPPYRRYLNVAPRVVTPQGMTRLVESVRLLLLLLQPVQRRRLHLLLRLVHKMAANPLLRLVPDKVASSATPVVNATIMADTYCRRTVLDDFGWSIVRGGEGEAGGRLLCLLVERHQQLLAPSEALERAMLCSGQVHLIDAPTTTGGSSASNGSSGCSSGSMNRLGKSTVKTGNSSASSINKNVYDMKPCDEQNENNRTIESYDHIYHTRNDHPPTCPEGQVSCNCTHCSSPVMNNSPYNMHYGGNTAHYGANTAHYGANTSHYGANTSHYGGNTAHYGGNTAHYGGTTAHYGGNTAHYGGNTAHYSGNTTQNVCNTEHNVRNTTRNGANNNVHNIVNNHPMQVIRNDSACTNCCTSVNPIYGTNAVGTKRSLTNNTMYTTHHHSTNNTMGTTIHHHSANNTMGTTTEHHGTNTTMGTTTHHNASSQTAMGTTTDHHGTNNTMGTTTHHYGVNTTMGTTTHHGINNTMGTTTHHYGVNTTMGTTTHHNASSQTAVVRAAGMMGGGRGGSSYCVQVPVSVYESQRTEEQQRQHLRDLLRLMYAEPTTTDAQIKQFADHYPDIYKSEAPLLPPRPVCSGQQQNKLSCKKASTSTFRDLLRLASRSMLVRQSKTHTLTNK